MFGMNRSNLVIPGLHGFYATMEPIAFTLTRIVFGVIMFIHGWPKLMVAGPDRVGANFVANYGLPYWGGYAVTFIEVAGGAALVIGLLTRFFASASAILLLVAMFAAHWAKGFSAGAGGYEYVMFLGFVAFYIAIRGGGPYSVDAKIGKEL